MACVGKPHQVSQLQVLKSFLAINSSVIFIKWFWYACDGFAYSRTLTTARCLTLAANSQSLQVHVSCIGGLANVQNLDPTFASPIGKSSLQPQWKSLLVLNTSHALVQCKVLEDLTLYPQLVLPSATQRCPRTCLERVLASAERDYGVTFLAGFEIEFYLLPKTGEGLGPESLQLPQRNGPNLECSPRWSSASSMRGLQAECIEACMLAVEKAGLVVEQAHAESSLNQYEIPTGPLNILEAIDAVICTREIIFETANAHGFRAIFIPKPFEPLRPTVLHLHLSVHQLEEIKDVPLESIQEPDNIPGNDEGGEEQFKTKRTVSRTPVSQEMANYFLGGILNRLVPLCAFSRSSQNSYLPSPPPSTTGDFVAWGRRNSSVPLNEVRQGHWEIRTLDWTTNIYLAAAAYVSAGLLGIRDSEKLRWEDPRNLIYKMNQETLKSLGIDERMPTSFEETLKSLISREYASLQDVMGEEILDLFVIVKEKGHEFVLSLGEEERMALFMSHF